MRFRTISVNIGSNKMTRTYVNRTQTVNQLTTEFEEACASYKDALGSRPSNRAAKELNRGNNKGTTIHKLQVNFAWILHEIEDDHESQVHKHVSRARELIEHIKDISND